MILNAKIPKEQSQNARFFFVNKLPTTTETFCTYMLPNHLHTAKPHGSDVKTQFNRCFLPVYCSFDRAERHPCASLGLCWTGSQPTIGLYNTNLK